MAVSHALWQKMLQKFNGYIIPNKCVILIEYAIVIHKIQILKAALVSTVPTGLEFYILTVRTF